MSSFIELFRWQNEISDAFHKIFLIELFKWQNETSDPFRKIFLPRKNVWLQMLHFLSHKAKNVTEILVLEELSWSLKNHGVDGLKAFTVAASIQPLLSLHSMIILKLSETIHVYMYIFQKTRITQRCLLLDQFNMCMTFMHVYVCILFFYVFVYSVNADFRI